MAVRTAVRAAASANMTRRKRVRKRRDEIACANLCELRDWRRGAVSLSLIITPQVCQNRLRPREAASEEEQFVRSATAFLFAVHGASAKTECEGTSLTTQDFSARGGQCQFLRRFVFTPFRPSFPSLDSSY